MSTGELVPQLLISSLTLGSIYSLTALGFAVIFRATGVVNFAQGELMMLGAMLALILSRDVHLSLWFAALSAIFLCTCLAYLIERVAFRPLIDAPHFTVLLSTVAVGQIVRSSVRAFYGQEVALFPPIFSDEPIQIWGLRITPLHVGVVGATIVTLLIFLAFFSYTKLGWGMRATAQNLRGALIVGVNTQSVFSTTWMIAGALAAVAGILLAPLFTVTPDMGIIGNKGFIAAIIGGFGSLGGAIVGGIILAATENIVGVFVSSAFKDVVVFGVLLLVLAAFPYGLFGRKPVTRV